MDTLKITVLTLFITCNLFPQDIITVPDEAIKPLVEFHANLNEPVNIFPLINSDSLQFPSFEVIKSSALDIEKNLNLVFIDYYSESKVDWNKKVLTNHFEVKSAIKEKFAIKNYHINFEIDTIHKQTILNSEPIFETGIRFSSSDSIIKIMKQIVLKNNDSINQFGQLSIKIKYLIGYDTIKLSKNDIGKKIRIDDKKYRLDNILNGKIYIQSLNSSNDLEKIENSRYIAYKDKKIVHLPNQNDFPLSFKEKYRMHPVILNDSLIQLPKNVYENYLKNLKSEKNKAFLDLVILDTKVDFDQIHILFPKYDYLKKELKARIKKENVDEIEIIQDSFPIETNKPKNQTISN